MQSRLAIRDASCRIYIQVAFLRRFYRSYHSSMINLMG
jgi:hypothetical protein